MRCGQHFGSLLRKILPMKQGDTTSQMVLDVHLGLAGSGVTTRMGENERAISSSLSRVKTELARGSMVLYLPVRRACCAETPALLPYLREVYDEKSVEVDHPHPAT